MSYLLSVNNSIQGLSSGQEFSTLLKTVYAGIEVDTTTVLSVKLLANTATPVVLPGMVKLQVLSVKSPSPVDVSLKKDSSNQPIFTGFPSNNFLLVNSTGGFIDRVELLSSVATVLEVAIAGKYS